MGKVEALSFIIHRQKIRIRGRFCYLLEHTWWWLIKCMHKLFRGALSFMIHISEGNVLGKEESTSRGFQIFGVLF